MSTTHIVPKLSQFGGEISSDYLSLWLLIFKLHHLSCNMLDPIPATLSSPVLEQLEKITLERLAL